MISELRDVNAKHHHKLNEKVLFHKFFKAKGMKAKKKSLSVYFGSQNIPKIEWAYKKFDTFWCIDMFIFVK